MPEPDEVEPSGDPLPAPGPDDDESPDPDAEVPPAEPAQPLIAPRRPPGRPRGKSSARRRVAAARRSDKPVLTPRMSIFINDDGDIVFDRTKPETIEQLRKAISKPEAQKRLGLVDDAGTPKPPRSWKGLTSVLVDSINAIAVQAAVNTWKLTDEQARLLFLKTEPGTYKQTIDLSDELLEKYFPGGFGEYDKEISLLLLLGGFTTTAVQKIQAMKSAGPREVTDNRPPFQFPSAQEN